MFRPFGNLVRLPDGRLLRKQETGGWIDANSGVYMNDHMVGNLMYSSIFYGGVPEGGRGKHSSGSWVLGVAGDLTITGWLQDARTASQNGTTGNGYIDFVWIGDSNTLRCNGGCVNGQAQGLIDNFITAGISLGIKMYGSPVNVVSGGNASGYKIWSYGIDTAASATKGWTSGNTYGIGGYESAFGAGGGVFSPNFDDLTASSKFRKDGYVWLPSGKTAYGNNMTIENTGAFESIGLTQPLTLRFLAGTTGNTGGILPIFQYDANQIRTRISDVAITFTGGFTAYHVGLTALALGKTGISVYPFGVNAAGLWATGPIAMAMNSLYTKSHGGMASSSFLAVQGVSLGGMFKALTLSGVSGGNNTTTNMLTELHNRQIAAGGPGRVCVVINGGVNEDTGNDTATKATNTINYTKNIITFVKNEWARAGLPENHLTFLVFHTWTIEVGASWSNVLTNVIEPMSTYAGDTNNKVTYVSSLKVASDYIGMTLGHYYDQTSSFPTAVHLSNGLTGGYHYVSYNILSALLQPRNRTTPANTYPEIIYGDGFGVEVPFEEPEEV